MFNKANNIKNAIHITKNAWNKLNTIQNNKYNQFLFSAKGGGCNGFSYNLKKITSDIQEFNISEFPPTTITQPFKCSNRPTNRNLFTRNHY